MPPNASLIHNTFPSILALSTDDSELSKVLSGFSPLGRISYFFQINSDFIHLPIQPILTRGERKDWRESKNLANPSKLLASGGKNLVNLAMITARTAKKGSASAKYYSSAAEVPLLALYTACVTVWGQNTLSSHTEATKEDLLICSLRFLSIFPPKAFLG